MDGPPQAWVDVPRGSIVAEDLGLEVIEGARRDTAAPSWMGRRR